MNRLHGKNIRTIKAGSIRDELDNDKEIHMMGKPLTKERYEYEPVTRMEMVYLHPNNFITSDIMTRYEYANVVMKLLGCK
jgi:hypothetical protein